MEFHGERQKSSWLAPSLGSTAVRVCDSSLILLLFFFFLPSFLPFFLIGLLADQPGICQRITTIMAKSYRPDSPFAARSVQLPLIVLSVHESVMRFSYMTLRHRLRQEDKAGACHDLDRDGVPFLGLWNSKRIALDQEKTSPSPGIVSRPGWNAIRKPVNIYKSFLQALVPSFLRRSKTFSQKC